MGADDGSWDVYDTLIPQTRANMFRFSLPPAGEGFRPLIDGLTYEVQVLAIMDDGIWASETMTGTPVLPVRTQTRRSLGGDDDEGWLLAGLGLAALFAFDAFSDDDEDVPETPPKVSLSLSEGTISEDDGMATVTASLDRAASGDTTVTVAV